MANEEGKAQTENRSLSGLSNCSLKTYYQRTDLGLSPLKQGTIEGESPVFDSEIAAYDARSRVELFGSAALIGW